MESKRIQKLVEGRIHISMGRHVRTRRHKRKELNKMETGIHTYSKQIQKSERERERAKKRKKYLASKYDLKVREAAIKRNNKSYRSGAG